MKLNKLQWAVLGAAVVLSVLLYIAPSKHTTKVEQSISLDKKVEEAVALVQSPEPMKGIQLLLEVVKEDPEHEQALLWLGAFAAQTGQWEKALARMETLVSVNPGVVDAYWYLGRAHAELGNTEKAIESLEKFAAESEDTELVSEAQRYITELKNS